MKRPAVALLCALASASAHAADPAAVAYPEGYRSWDHVKSMVINEGHPLYDAVGGIHSVYGNPRAIEGYRAEKRFADGAVIVFDLFEALARDNAVSEGSRKAILVMARDRARYPDTDGWGYQVFDPQTRTGTLDASRARECHACHTQVRDQGYVFSAWRP
jgi:hypothetical protein